MAAEHTSRRRWWAPIGLGAVFCLGCCMAPILIAAGILGGGVTLVSLSWLEPLGIALIAAGAIGFFWSRTRTRCASTSGVCADSGCGCTTSTTTAL